MRPSDRARQTQPMTTQLDRPPLTLVLLAAGAGSRYGGAKQMDSFGPAGETIMEYSMYDALRAGFTSVVLVTRPDLEDTFRRTVEARAGRRISIRYVHQRLGDLPPGFLSPPGRTTPWGTAQAVLAAAGLVSGPFAVANADDLYGSRAYAALAACLGRQRAEAETSYALVAYRLGDTLSESGTVSRGVCDCSPDGWLKRIVEEKRIEKHGSGGRVVDDMGAARLIAADALVSMNLWGFEAAFFSSLRAGFSRFLDAHGSSLEREYYLPQAVSDAISGEGVRVRVLPSAEQWHGVTHRGDRPLVEAALRELTARGTYPSPLWGR